MGRYLGWLVGVLVVLGGCSDPPERGADPAASKASGVPPVAIAPGSGGTAGSVAAVKIPLPAVKPSRVILDTFEVGENVFVRSLMVEPKRNVLWVGTSVGVHEISLSTKSVLQTFTRKEGLANEYVFGLGLDSEDHVWFGTNAGGASRYKDGNWRTFFPMHGLADYWVYSFASHPDGSLWIGTWAGVSRFDLRTGEFRNYVKELVNEWVYAIHVDTKQRLWFGTEGGVSRFDGREWRSWTHRDGLGAANPDQLPVSANTGLGTRKRHDLGVLSGGRPTYNPNYVFSLLGDPLDAEQNRVWAGTWGGGVATFDGERWTNATTRDGLPGNIVFSLVRDADSEVWAGTENGLARWVRGGSSPRSGQWVPFEQNDQLQGSSIYAMVATPDGEIWAGTRGKVIRIGRSAGSVP